MCYSSKEQVSTVHIHMGPQAPSENKCGRNAAAQRLIYPYLKALYSENCGAPNIRERGTQPNSQVSEDADRCDGDVTGANTNYFSAVSFIYGRPVTLWALRWLIDP